MKIKLSLVFFALITITVLAQDTAVQRGILSQGFGDLGAVKVQAEHGDVAAQVRLADAYLANFKSSDALKWYKAAAAHSLVAQFQLGNLLLFGRIGIPQEERVIADPETGLKWTYMAAIHGYKEAWRNMAKALQLGVGCSTNLTEAYAWLSLLAENGDIVGRVEMNSLALKLSSAEIIHGKSIEQGMMRGQWPALARQHLDIKLNGVIWSADKPLATINGKVFAIGETMSIKIKNETVKIKCLKIEADAVLILVDGEVEPRLLHLN